MAAALLACIRWMLLAAIIAGPGIAIWSFGRAQTLERIGRDGVEAVAVIDGGEREPGRRSVARHRLHAVWDAGGTERAETIAVSSEYAGRVIDGDFITIETAQVKYLPGEPDTAAVIAEDLPQQMEDAQVLLWLGVGAGVLGLIGIAIFVLGGRKKETPPAEPQDSKSGPGV